ncbi:MAG: HemK/PrmC family methyltransferase [Polyangiales bacterium]
MCWYRVRIPKPWCKQRSSYSAMSRMRVLDLCTGTGAVGLSIAAARDDIALALSDVSESALKVARANTEKLDLQARVQIVQSDLFSALNDRAYDMIVCNPPYIPSADIATLAPEVQHEPRLALDGGEDGLVLCRKIVEGAPRHLVASASLLMEIGMGQADALQEWISERTDLNMKWIDAISDLNGVDRVVHLRRAS